MMKAMQTDLRSNYLRSNKVNDKHSDITEQLDHAQLCQWLSDVANNRDKQAFTHLFKFFAPKILRIARSKLNSEAQASEVVQDTMSNVWRKAHLFDASKGAATTWVYTVMRNVSFDLLRKVKANKEDSLSDDIFPMAESTISDDDTFADHLENKRLLGGIGLLPENQQQVVKGFYLMEMSQEQLAQQLNLPLGTIKSRLKIGLRELRKVYNP